MPLWYLYLSVYNHAVCVFRHIDRRYGTTLPFGTRCDVEFCLIGFMREKQFKGRIGSVIGKSKERSCDKIDLVFSVIQKNFIFFRAKWLALDSCAQHFPRENLPSVE